MRRREFLRASIPVASAIGVTGCLGDGNGADGPAFEEGFESGLGEWEAGAAIGPEVDLGDFEWELEVSGERAFAGERSLRIWNEGDYDDGVTWGVHPIPIEPETSYEATVTAQLWSESESFNTLRDAIMRLGQEPPSTEEDFPQPGVNTTDLGITPYGGLREPLWLTDGWREYRFTWQTPALNADTLYVAVGTAVIWEGDATHFVDEVRVELTPQ